MKLSLFDIKLHTMSLISILILYINLLFVTILKLFFFHYMYNARGEKTTTLVWNVELTGWNLLIFESHKKSNALKSSYNRRQPLFYVKIYRDNVKCLWVAVCFNIWLRSSVH